MKKFLIIGLFLLASQVAFAANPYSVAGGTNSPARLGMPADSEVYDWNNLRSENLFNMVRPCHYWTSVGANERDHGYHPNTDTIHNESSFRNWVRNNTGKIWIIANETDIRSQDDLSDREYARMFKKYYDVIGDEDRSATFAVAAPGGLKGNESWSSQKDFFEGFIDSYKSQFGSPPPVDVWNTHVYGRSSGDVNWCLSLIDDFIDWVRTTEGGIYTNSEIIITEFGLFGDHSDSTMINFMDNICEEFETRVDQGQLDRFFWFLGAWCPKSDCGDWEASSLFGPNGNPTPLGQAYAHRANSWNGGSGISYTLTTAVFGSGSVNPSGGTYDENAQVQLTATAAAGWSFRYWSGHMSGSANPTTITMNFNKSVTAVFTETAVAQYSLTVNTSGSGSVSPSGGTYAEGTQVQLTATPATGWTFDHWSGDLSGSANPATISMSSNRTVTAVFSFVGGGGGNSFELNPIADDFYPKGTGDDNHIKTQSNKTGLLKFDLSGVTGLVLSATLRCVTSQDKPGTTHSYGSEDDSWVEGSLTGNPTLGPQLDSATNSGKDQQVVWDVTSFVATQVPAAGGDGTATLALNGPNQVYFESRENNANATVLSITTSDAGNTTYELAISVSGSGSVSPSGGMYAEGTQVQLTATAVSGWAFDHWSGDLSGSANPATITLDSDKTVTAVFTESPPVQYNLTVSTSGSGSVSPSGGMYAEGTQVQLTATAASGWTFDHWSGDLSGSANPATITMSSNRTVTAVFTYAGGGGGGSFELDPIADDFYPKGTGDDNHIKTQSNKTGFLKFDLSGVTGLVVSATLKCVTSQDKPGTTHSYGSEDDSWVEGGLTGNLSLGPQLDSATNSGKNQQVVWDVTSFIATQVLAAGGDGMATLALEGPNQVYFKSRENDANATVLSITTSD